MGCTCGGGGCAHALLVHKCFVRKKQTVGLRGCTSGHSLASQTGVANGTKVCFHDLLLLSPSACLPFCSRTGWRGGRKQNGSQEEGLKPKRKSNGKQNGSQRGSQETFFFCGCAAAGGLAGWSTNSSFRNNLGNRLENRCRCGTHKQNPCPLLFSLSRHFSKPADPLR